MANRDKYLFESLRARGVRKKAANKMARATNGSASSKAARQAMSDLASVVAEIHDRLRDGPEKRSAAAKKAAKTRKRQAHQRSQSAKRGAHTRARA